MKTYGVVLIGCGAMGAAHLDSIAQNKRVRLVGVADLVEEKASKFAETYHAESWSTNYKEYLLREDVDIVIVATYPSTHLEMTKRCAEAGKHVLCEKPMCGTMKEADEFLAMAQTVPSKIVVGHILRHNTTFQLVRDMIRGGALGGPIMMRMSQIKKTVHNWNSHLALLNEVSPLVDCGVHYIDVMRWFTGAEVVSVSGIGQRLQPDIPHHTYNYGMSTFQFSDGSIGYYEAGWGHSMPNDNLKEFIGPRGRIRITYRSQRKSEDQHLGNLVEFEHADGKAEQINIGYDHKPTDAQFAFLLEMIESNLDPLPFLREVHRATEVMLLADRAIHEGRVIHCLPLAAQASQAAQEAVNA